MAFNLRQFDELGTIEVCYATINPGTIVTAGKFTVTVTPVIGGPNSIGQSAAFNSASAVGDRVLAVIPSAAAGSMGSLIIDAQCVGSGQVAVNLYNTSPSSITPASAVWQFIILRNPPNVIE